MKIIRATAFLALLALLVMTDARWQPAMVMGLSREEAFR
jgi:hypothetical protein